jgi:pyruvate dehydrogenase E1 component alpha subunit
VLRRLDPDGVLLDGSIDGRAEPAPLDRSLVERLLHDMARARVFDRAALKLARRGRIKGYYPSIGQEALAALAPGLEASDMVFPAYREQPLRLAMGITPAQELAMWAGAAGAPWDPMAARCMPANTSIGAHVPHAVGWAQAQRRLGSSGVAVAVFGDGATSEGDVHAAMTLAGVWRSPVVLVCQNNQYAQTTSLAQQTAAPTLAAKAAGYGIPGVRVDGMDPLAVHDAFIEAAARARSGGGATFLELVTYRFAGHSSFEVAPAYRGRDEEARWRALDPLRRTAALLTAMGGDPAAVVREAESGMTTVLDGALAALDHGALPTLDDVVAWSRPVVDALPTVPLDAEGATPVAAVAAGLHERMAADDRVVVLGEDVVTSGGIWGATTGLADAFGDRVVDTPLTEQGIVGAAVGMALAGLHRPHGGRPTACASSPVRGSQRWPPHRPDGRPHARRCGAWRLRRP